MSLNKHAGDTRWCERSVLNVVQETDYGDVDDTDSKKHRHRKARMA
jgi:hypothetical protein